MKTSVLSVSTVALFGYVRSPPSHGSSDWGLDSGSQKEQRDFDSWKEAAALSVQPSKRRYDWGSLSRVKGALRSKILIHGLRPIMGAWTTISTLWTMMRPDLAPLIPYVVFEDATNVEFPHPARHIQWDWKDGLYEVPSLLVAWLLWKM